MDTPHTTQTNGDETSVDPRPSLQHLVPSPTHKDFIEILTAVKSEVQRRYGHIPHLCTTLTDTLQDSITDNESIKLDPRYDPEQALITMIRVERQILNAYNKHRLGEADWRYKYQSVPEGKVDYYRTHNLLEQLDAFPFHSEVLRRGFKLPALRLRLLYQTPEPGVAATAVATSSTAGTGNTETSSKTPGVALNAGKFTDAPSAGLAFPDGNITLAEIATFLPESMKSWDIIDRLIGNGATSATLAKLTNHFRDMPRGAITSNSVYRTMKCPINIRAKTDSKWKGWTVGTHRDIANQEVDRTSVSVAGFRQRGNTTVPAIPFKNLANGVKVFPTGYDALDLTRCVIYCQQHPEENWLYPTDYARLLNHLPSGPAQVEEGHYDATAIARWTSESTIRLTANIRTRDRDACGRLLKKDRGNEDENLDKDQLKKNDLSDPKPATPRPAKPAKSVLKGAPSLSEIPTSLNHIQAGPSRFDVESDSDSDTYQGPKKMKKRVGPVRTSGRTRNFTGSYSVDLALGTDKDDEIVDDTEMGEDGDDDTEMGDDEDEDIEMGENDVIEGGE